MDKTFKRVYKDFLGVTREIKYIETKNYLIKWYLDVEAPAEAEIWQLENGSIIQIPSNAWSILNVPYIDIKE